MRFTRRASLLAIALLAGVARSDGRKDEVKEKALDAPNKLTIQVRMEGPYDAETPLQVVCYFKHKKAGDKTLGAAVELDKRLKGVIAALRDRDEFAGDELETLLLIPAKDTIKPKMLLLCGLGEEDTLSLERLERVGRVALREAAKLNVKKVAFAPLIRDQGNSKFNAGAVEQAVTKGMLLAYDTEVRLQKEHLGKEFTLATWVVEAGPDYFDDTVSGIQKAIAQAKQAIADRGSVAYQKEGK